VTAAPVTGRDDLPREGSGGPWPRAVTMTKTISESDVYQFAGITGDFAPIHVDAEYARCQPVGRRVVHGVLVVGLMSAASTAWCRAAEVDTLSYGYDRIRFVRPVMIGDTVTVHYEVVGHRPEKRQYVGRVEASNQRGEIVAVAEHILWEFPSGEVAAVGRRDGGRQ